MNRKDYEKTTDYKKSVQLVKEFVDEVLEGDIVLFSTLNDAPFFILNSVITA